MLPPVQNKPLFTINSPFISLSDVCGSNANAISMVSESFWVMVRNGISLPETNNFNSGLSFLGEMGLLNTTWQWTST